jgi:hypothetical protein
MQLAAVFRRLVLAEVAALPTATTGRPQTLCADQALDTDGVSMHFKQFRGDAESVSKARVARKQKYDKMAAARAEARCAKAEGRDVVRPPKPPPTKQCPPVTELQKVLPKRDIWCIDALKRVSRDEYHVVGVDPGMHNLVQAVDSERREARDGNVRYTLQERRRDLRTEQYATEARRNKPVAVVYGEASLSNHQSKAVSVDDFVAYCACRHRFLDEALSFYGNVDHRHRRRKRMIKARQSEEKLVRRLKELQQDDRPLLLAYGSWGATTSKAFRNIPPCVGVGLMRRLAHRFVVVVTPEHYTSKTCARCLGPCGPHPTLRHATLNGGDGREIRGLRVCQNEECKQFANRDHMGACNIATNFERLVAGLPSIRQLSRDETEMHRLRCMECAPEE